MENNNTAIFDGLNDAQDAAVRCVKGPVLIVAGAGSGKTRVLTSRIAHLIASGVDAERILALTFTKKAAQEMKERANRMLYPQNARKVCMGTFHSVFIRFLRDYAEPLGFPKDFTIYDTSDSQACIKAIVKEKGLDEKAYKPKDVLSRISMAKNNLVMPRQYMQTKEITDADMRKKMPRIGEIYLEYMTRCKKSGVMDFDDILIYMNFICDHPEVVKELAGRFDYVLVDEYQDTNAVQYSILKKLAQFHRNICVVGDDAQSIYAFRGAKIANILNFSKDYPDYHVFRLEQNYRSTQVIVDAANSLIEHNANRIKKKCFSKSDTGEKIRIIEGYTPDEEANLIAGSIKGRIASAGAAYKDFAILYRKNSQSRALEEALRKANIPYIIFAGKSFFDRAEVKDLMAYFKLVVNNKDDESFKRIVNKPARAIGETTVAAIAACAADSGVSMFEAASKGELQNFGLRAGAVEKVRAFCTMISAHTARAAVEDAYDVAKSIAYESGLYQFYKQDQSIEGQAKLSNVEELINNVRQVVEEQHNADYEEIVAADTAENPDSAMEISERDLPVVTLSRFLENITLISNIDMSEDEEDNDNKVALMTVHSSKGLEFPYVYVSGMEEALFPSGGMQITPDELEEERRLFYVALTRAQKVVTLTYSKTRMNEGHTDIHAPSRFLRDIDSQFLVNPLPDGSSAADRGGAFCSRGSFGSPFAGRGGSGYGGSRSGSGYGRGGSGYGGVGSSGRSGAGSYGYRGGAGGWGGSNSRSEGGFMRPDDRRSSGITPNRKPATPAVRKDPPADFVPSPISELRIGQRVEHNRFGLGTLKDFSGEMTERAAVISFDDFGEKKLLLKYAKIRIVK